MDDISICIIQGRTDGLNWFLIIVKQIHSQKRMQAFRQTLSAIAKGFGVDEIAETLRGFGIKNYMVEIGGDLFAQGHNSKRAKMADWY